MSEISSQFNFSQLSVADRLTLIGEIWDSIDSEQSLPDITPEQKQELKRRIEDCKENPDKGSSWEEVKERIKGGEQ